MPSDHTTGASQGSRQGCIPAVHSLHILFTSPLNRKFLRVSASVSKPLLIKFEAVTSAQFNATVANQVRIGKTSGAADLVAAKDIGTTGTPLPINTPLTLGAVLLTADTDIFVGMITSGTPATTGDGFVKATLEEMNVTEPSQTSNIP